MSRLFLGVLLLATLGVAWAGNIEISFAPNKGKASPVVVEGEKATLLGDVLKAALATPAANFDGKCPASFDVKYDGKEYTLCEKHIINADGKQHPIDGTLVFDIIHYGKKEKVKVAQDQLSKLAPITQEEQVLVAALDTARAGAGSAPGTAMAFREKFASAARARAEKGDSGFTPLQPRFAQVSPVAFDPTFPGVGRTHTANCYGYATNSRLWGSTGCYSDAAGGNVALPGNWGEGWCKAGAFMSDRTDDPCTALMASVNGDGLTDADPGNHIKVAVFAHVFVALLPANGYMTEAVDLGTHKLFCMMDYHYHREDSNGKWSDKNGQTPVTPAQFDHPVLEDLDRTIASLGQLGTALRDGNSFFPNLGYTKFCGYKYSSDGLLSGKHNNC